MQLVKRDDRYDLYADDGHKLGSTSPNPIGKLSQSNCQAIEFGFDIEQLAEEYMEQFKNPMLKNYKLGEAFINGFKKALEFKMYDKEDLYEAYLEGYNDDLGFEELVQELQPTELEVEFVMETCSMNPLDLNCSEIIEKPKKDSNGCLILKRKI